MNTIAQNIERIKNRIEYSCHKSGRDPKEVKLLLATKTVPVEKIKLALATGEVLIGENKVQELKEKFDDLKEIPHDSHFIGHLQSNKIKDVIKYADCIQSIDRLALAKKIQERLEFEDKTMDVFLQINTSYEASKFGMNPEDAIDLSLQISEFNRLKIKGLMTIGLFSTEADKIRKCFRLLKGIQCRLLDKGFAVNEMSMGMSGDIEIAIEEGSTMVRVGTAIFGDRPYPDSYYWNESN